MLNHIKMTWLKCLSVGDNKLNLEKQLNSDEALDHTIVHVSYSLTPVLQRELWSSMRGYFFARIIPCTATLADNCSWASAVLWFLHPILYSCHLEIQLIIFAFHHKQSPRDFWFSPLFMEAPVLAYCTSRPVYFLGLILGYTFLDLPPGPALALQPVLFWAGLNSVWFSYSESFETVKCTRPCLMFTLYSLCPLSVHWALSYCVF